MKVKALKPFYDKEEKINVCEPNNLFMIEDGSKIILVGDTYETSTSRAEELSKLGYVQKSRTRKVND